MRNFIAAVTLFLLTSCSALSEGIAEGRELLTKLNDTVDKIKPQIEETIKTGAEIVASGAEVIEAAKELKTEFSAMKADAFKKADKDGDGDLNFGERLQYWLLLAAGAASIGVGVKRKFAGLQTLITGEVANLNGRVDHERAKRKEAAVNGQAS